MTAPTRVMFGLGTGRCGTNSLAALIALQPGAVGTHERRGHRVAWVGGEAEVDRVLDALAADLAQGATLVGEVGLYYLPYVAGIRARFPEARFIVLQRDRAATVASFLDKTADKSNHWAPTPRFARHARWSACFPTYEPGLDKAAAIGRYWDEATAPGQKAARDRGNTFIQISAQETDKWMAASASLHDDWVADMDKRGLPGKQMLQDAKDLIKKLGSQPVHVSGDRFKAKDQPNVPEKAKPTVAQQRARRENIKKAQAARHEQ